MKIDSNYNLTRINNKPSFKRNWSEHASWGARFVKETGKTNFKLFSFPDAKAVFVEIAQNAGKNFGNIKERIVQILATQGAIFSINKIVSQDEDSQIYPMQNKGNGIFEAEGIETEENAQYRYIIVKNNNEINLVKDPYARRQSNINGWSEIYNPINYEWKATDWLEGKDPRRIIRKPNEPLRGLENLFIEEINIPTLSKEGTFEKAKNHIDKIVKKGVATAIEIMPVENTFSLQWGYDGVDKFAVNEKMGGAVKLKELIDYAHSKGLNVIMDMVPNHMGPDGNYLKQTGPYLRQKPGPWGDMFNYEGQNNTSVRDYMVNAALWWINEFKVDGIRFDMTQRCDSDWLLKQLNVEIHEHNPEVFLIAEDARDKNQEVTTYDNSSLTHSEQLEKIDNAIKIVKQNRRLQKENKPKINEIPIKDLGFDSEWDFKLMHSIVEAYVENKPINLDSIDSNLQNSRHRVKFAMSHDEIGNLDGTRLIPKTMKYELDLCNKVRDIEGVEIGHTAAHLAHKLAEICAQRNIEEMPYEELHQIAVEAGLDSNKHLNPQAVQRAFNIAKAQHKLAQGTILTIPGPKMFFQGDDEMQLAKFKFFRELSSDSHDRKNQEYVGRILREKGYDTLESIARAESIVDSVKIDPKYEQETLRFTQDLSNLVKSNPALLKGEIINTYKDYHNQIHTHHLKYENEEVLVIKHFGQFFKSREFNIANFPDGNWQEIFNSDKDIYGGLNFVNEDRQSTITRSSQNLNLAPNSIVILRRV